jgi:hypothetical protein
MASRGTNWRGAKCGIFRLCGFHAGAAAAARSVVERDAAACSRTDRAGRKLPTFGGLAGFRAGAALHRQRTIERAGICVCVARGSAHGAGSDGRTLGQGYSSRAAGGGVFHQ